MITNVIMACYLVITILILRRGIRLLVKDYQKSQKIDVILILIFICLIILWPVIYLMKLIEVLLSKCFN